MGNRGFTMIGMLIVVAILAILTLIPFGMRSEWKAYKRVSGNDISFSDYFWMGDKIRFVGRSGQ
jgi:prepilin-type N-terminal cleavage/methylation domain-containing protein